MLDIVRGSYENKLVMKNKLDKYFSTSEDYEGTLYIGYPIIGEGESIDALWISKKYSIIILIYMKAIVLIAKIGMKYVIVYIIRLIRPS